MSVNDQLADTPIWRIEVERVPRWVYDTQGPFVAVATFGDIYRVHSRGHKERDAALLEVADIITEADESELELLTAVAHRFKAGYRNLAYIGAFKRGWRDAADGKAEQDCPYPDARTYRGGVTFSRAFQKYWRQGHAARLRHERTDP